MTWQVPWAILLLLVIPLLWWRRKTQRRYAYHSDVAALKFALGRSKQRHFKLWLQIPRILRALALVATVLAMAQYSREPQPRREWSQGLDIMLVVDTSMSMQALDFKIKEEPSDRLTVVKHVLRQFVAERPSDRFGIVVFGSEVYTQAPLTLDHSIILQLLDDMKIGAAGDGTAIGDAVATAVKRVKDLPSANRVVVLLTDGDQTAGVLSPSDAAEAAKTLGVKVYTIAVGKQGKVPMPVTGMFGQQSYRWVESRIDETSLKNIAEATNAQFFRAYETDELQKVYSAIDKLEKRNIQEVKQERPQTVDWKWLVYALIAIVAEHIWLFTRKQRAPC